MKQINRYATLALLLSGLICPGWASSDGGSSGSLMALDHQPTRTHKMKQMTAQPVSVQPMSQEVPAAGVIKAVDSAARKVKVLHQPIEAWGMGSMQMTFHLAPEVDINSLKKGMRIHFMLQNPSVGKYIITKIIRH